MKITTIIGSPRPTGNCATIAKALLESIATDKDQTRIFELNRLTYRGCQACMACKTIAKICVVNDELAVVLDEVGASDVTIIAAPVYVGDISAQTKGLVDRCYSFLSADFKTNPNPGRLAAGKKLVFIVAQGNPDGNSFGDIVPRYSRMFARLGFADVYPIRALGMGPEGNPLEHPDIAGAIRETAERIAAGSKRAKPASVTEGLQPAP